MTDNIVKLPTKAKITWAIFVPTQRTPIIIEATDFEVSEDRMLYLRRGPDVVAMFNNWDYAEMFEERESA